MVLATDSCVWAASLETAAQFSLAAEATPTDWRLKRDPKCNKSGVTAEGDMVYDTKQNAQL